MSIFDRFRRKAVIIRRDAIAASILNQSIEEVYRTQPALRACVSFLAENAGSLPLKCYERKSDTDRPRVSEGVVPALLARPNRWEALQDVLVGVFSDYLLYGWALLYVIPSKDMASGWEMVRIPIPWIQQKDTVDGFSLSKYTVNNPNTTSRPVDLSADDCIRIASYDPQGQVLACSPVEALKQVLAEQISAWDFRNATWKNGGKIGGAYLKRPLGADWSKEAKERFVESWKNKFSGEGDDTGGTPLLEDGMELVSMQFNAREAEWAEATKLARGDVAAVYHVNPALIWHDQSMTYASAKDNARALYADTLAPILSKIESAFNTFLLPKIGAPEKEYLEFDLSAKLQGSFEEQAQVLQSAVGRPYILPNEARARMNLPSIDGGDELAMPLNMTTGSSENNIQENGELAYVMPLKEARPTLESRGVKQNEEIHVLSKASPSAERDIADVLDAFYKRQAQSIANQLASMPPDELVLDGYMEWWHKDRWVRELSHDMERVSLQPAHDAAYQALRALGVKPDNPDLSVLDTDITNLCDFRADDIVQSTLARVTNDLKKLDSLTPESIRSCVQESYKSLQDGRVERNSQSMATAIANAGTHGGAKASGYKCTKTWRSFPGARKSHARMNGETVFIDSRFSNGARWPGDTNLSAEESCNCRCRIEIKKANKLFEKQVKNDLEKELGDLEGCDPEKYGAAWSGMQVCTIPRNKIENWSLLDKDKAQAFRQALGYEQKDATQLIFELYTNASLYNSEFEYEDEWGKRWQNIFVLDGINDKRGSTASVKVGWIKSSDDDKLRLVTAFVDK